VPIWVVGRIPAVLVSELPRRCSSWRVAAKSRSSSPLEATSKTEFDLAILDADLKGRSVSPVADALVARDIGFVFVTGYGDHGLLAYRNRPMLNKPFQIDALKRCCTSALEQSSQQALPRVGTPGEGKRGAGRSGPLRPFAYRESEQAHGFTAGDREGLGQ
jgi:DNA-binding NtrC family response regulator